MNEGKQSITKKKLMKTKILSFLFFVLLLTNASANDTFSKEPKKKQTIKVALLLDTSNSMDGLINQAKAQLWKIVNELSYAKYGVQKPDLKIAIYEYGNDGLESADNYIRQVLGFSDDLDDISEKLFSLTTNGGQEYCGSVIQKSTRDLDWGKNENDLKFIFIAGNERFTQGDIHYKEAIAEANKKDIFVNTIFCGSYEQGIHGKWQDGANLGGGDYMIIDQNKRIKEIETPFDTQIIILNRKLNSTYIYYGKYGKKSAMRLIEQDSNAQSIAAPVSVSRAVTKSSRLYNNSKWDLIDAFEAKKIDLSKLNKKDLPKKLQNKNAKELQQYIEQKQKERQKIKKDILALNKKRRSYIATKQIENGKENELETVMISAIKRQAAQKNYKW